MMFSQSNEDQRNIQRKTSTSGLRRRSRDVTRVGMRCVSFECGRTCSLSDVHIGGDYGLRSELRSSPVVRFPTTSILAEADEFEQPEWTLQARDDPSFKGGGERSLEPPSAKGYLRGTWMAPIKILSREIVCGEQ